LINGVDIKKNKPEFVYYIEGTEMLKSVIRKGQ